MTATAGRGTPHDRLTALADRRIAEGETRGLPAADPVNLPMIRHWADAMGDANPLHTDPEAAAAGVHGEITAPPAMIQVWTMPGVRRDAPRAPTPVDDVLAMLDADGYTGVVATDCEQTHHRYLRLGERPVPATRLSALAGPKKTALGEGYFVTWNVTWYSDDEAVAEMLFRVLKFRPPAGAGRRTAAREPHPMAAAGTGTGGEAAAGTGTGADGNAAAGPYPLRPAVNADTAFFWEGAAVGELRVQRCADCGLLRHPPGPVCPSCRSAARTHVTASGRGEVYSYVVHHNPPVPGLRTPFVVAVVELPEGVRIVGNVVDCPPAEVRIGMAVRVTYRRMDEELTLPVWVPVPAPGEA
ncbi:hypothetical protein FHS43_005291 [Streptosporangium becharense]|uniref:Putative OB-fold protein n=1 Tax=Streptosporangium becharense TaxID=1816182 RepID=A0A7W9IIH1_9ACTN|nr:bifunctional MaoC family dehydratase N-terminal/OB-fold nucleic acid binding domain-containing protein [Streptosporangium becharense]MBB2913982.1 hypothetical protein [Streptosporangium becharense]MBB5821357.1 putative OB-fold protein [Streptosporangium becharense]